jgi:hypothetical protein
VLRFKDFLSEEKRDPMKGSLTGSESSKAAGHVTRYITPYLSHEQVKKTKENLGQHMNTSGFDKHGSTHHDPSAHHTHILGAKANGHEAGTHVRVTHVSMDDKRKLWAHTEKHGAVPVSSLEKPKELKAENKSGAPGFELEHRIAKNLGTKPAGSTGESWDYVHNGREEASGRKKQPAVRGVFKTVEQATKSPKVRGESKLDKGKMGQGVLSHDSKTRTWSVNSKSSPEVAEHMKKTTVKGKDGKERSLLDHLNTFHSNGHIEKGFVAHAPEGMSRAYLNGIKANSLHIHHKQKDVGTTFTIGDKNDLHGKTNLGHLSNEHLDHLDGKINVGKTDTGKASIIHRPKQPEMRRLATLSESHPDKHKSLTNEHHAKEFVAKVMEMK